MVKNNLKLFLGVLFATGAIGCAGGEQFINTANLPDNPYCNQMKEVCKEAREFESNYARLSPDEQKDAENILKAYRMQCNDATDACKKSAGK